MKDIFPGTNFPGTIFPRTLYSGVNVTAFSPRVVKYALAEIGAYFRPRYTGIKSRTLDSDVVKKYFGNSIFFLIHRINTSELEKLNSQKKIEKLN